MILSAQKIMIIISTTTITPTHGRLFGEMMFQQKHGPISAVNVEIIFMQEQQMLNFI